MTWHSELYNKVHKQTNDQIKINNKTKLIKMKKVTQKNIVVEIIEECDPFWKAQTNLIKKKKGMNTTYIVCLSKMMTISFLCQVIRIHSKKHYHRHQIVSSTTTENNKGHPRRVVSVYREMWCKLWRRTKKFYDKLVH